jgi:hypothetical protein
MKRARPYDATTMIRINDVKAILRKRTYIDMRYRLIDISAGSASGDAYNLVEQVRTLHEFKDEEGKVVTTDYMWDTVRFVARSHDTNLPEVVNKIGGVGAYGPTFDIADLAEIMEGEAE